MSYPLILVVIMERSPQGISYNLWSNTRLECKSSKLINRISICLFVKNIVDFNDTKIANAFMSFLSREIICFVDLTHYLRQLTYLCTLFVVEICMSSLFNDSQPSTSVSLRYSGIVTLLFVYYRPWGSNGLIDRAYIISFGMKHYYRDLSHLLSVSARYRCV